MEGNWASQIGPNNKYQYNGKELNEDFGLNWNDYGARFYDAAIGRWNHVDPLAEDYTTYSPYSYTLNNPIRLVDPTGMAPEWFPEIQENFNSEGQTVSGQLVLRQEDGDNAETLAQFLGVSQEKADQLFLGMSNDGLVTPTDDISGVSAINESINTAILKRGTSFGMTTPGSHSYNCFTSCLSISQGKDFQRGGNNNTSSMQFDKELGTQYEDVTGNVSNYKFGSTVLKFEANNWTIFGGNSSSTEHGAIYLGTSKNGTIHTWSKNGMIKAPAVQTVSQLKSSYDSWLFGGNVSYHNLK